MRYIFHATHKVPHAEERPEGASPSTLHGNAAGPLSEGLAPIVSLRGVGKRFPSGLEALSGIDLTVVRGEFLSLLGPSGCGKSTLLRIVAGLTPPTAGSCELALGGGAEKPAPAGRIGFVFQDPTLMP